jgi:hypothetical protein
MKVGKYECLFIEHLVKMMQKSEKFCKIWKILEAVLMQACDLENLENLKNLHYHVTFRILM